MSLLDCVQSPICTAVCNRTCWIPLSLALSTLCNISLFQAYSIKTKLTTWKVKYQSISFTYWAGEPVEIYIVLRRVISGVVVIFRVKLGVIIIYLCFFSYGKWIDLGPLLCFFPLKWGRNKRRGARSGLVTPKQKKIVKKTHENFVKNALINGSSFSLNCAWWRN